MFVRPGILEPVIVQMNFHGLMAMADEITGIEIRNTEQTVVSSRHLLSIARPIQRRILCIQFAQERRIISGQDGNAHNSSQTFEDQARRPSEKRSSRNALCAITLSRAAG